MAQDREPLDTSYLEEFLKLHPLSPLHQLVVKSKRALLFKAPCKTAVVRFNANDDRAIKQKAVDDATALQAKYDEEAVAARASYILAADVPVLDFISKTTAAFDKFLATIHDSAHLLNVPSPLDEATVVRLRENLASRIDALKVKAASTVVLEVGTTTFKKERAAAATAAAVQTTREDVEMFAPNLQSIQALVTRTVTDEFAKMSIGTAPVAQAQHRRSNASKKGKKASFSSSSSPSSGQPLQAGPSQSSRQRSPHPGKRQRPAVLETPSSSSGGRPQTKKIKGKPGQRAHPKQSAPSAAAGSPRHLPSPATSAPSHSPSPQTSARGKRRGGPNPRHQTPNAQGQPQLPSSGPAPAALHA